MQKLCDLGNKVPNIMIDKTAVIGKTFRLDNEWLNLAHQLGLPDENYVYMLWLWMEKAWTETLVREQDGGSQKLSILSQRGSASLKDTITTMKLEVPLLTLAEEFSSQTQGQSCLDIFQ